MSGKYDQTTHTIDFLLKNILIRGREKTFWKNALTLVLGCGENFKVAAVAHKGPL